MHTTVIRFNFVAIFTCIKLFCDAAIANLGYWTNSVEQTDALESILFFVHEVYERLQMFASTPYMNLIFNCLRYQLSTLSIKYYFKIILNEVSTIVMAKVCFWYVTYFCVISINIFN